MIRPLLRPVCLLVLLANASFSIAQPLYKWTEADGSITFSPRKPPGGVQYETVNSNGARAEKRQQAPTAVDTLPATKSAHAGQSDSNPADELPRLRYTPGANDALPAVIGQSFSTAPESRSPAVPPGTGIAVVTGLQPNEQELTADSSTVLSAASHKQGRCQDLRKRVVSLERRLKSHLSADDMDNTVIQMARYQQSFDQHCVQ